MDSENKIAETMRSIENIWRLFYEDQNSRNSPTQLDEDILGFKRVITNIVEHVTFEEKYFKSPTKMCRNCGKMKKVWKEDGYCGRCKRRFAYFGKHPQQPSSIRLVSTHQGCHSQAINEKSATTLFQDFNLVTKQKSRSRSRSISPARSATSSTGLNSPSRYQRTSSWSQHIRHILLRHLYSSGNEREPHPRGRTLDHRRRSLDYSCSSSRSTSRSRSPDEVYSHRRNRGSNVHPSNHSTDKVGWFRRIRNKLGFHHQNDHHHHPSRHNTGVKSSKEDETFHTHHRSVANPVSNGKLHRQSNDQMVRKNNRRTQVKNEPKQHGHVRKFFGGVVGHFLGSNKSKPSTAGSSNVGKSRAKLVMKTKHPKSKGYKHNTKMKKLLLVHRKWCNSTSIKPGFCI
ncbi:hypothetical protein MKW92_043390 [Papaver armeniacum]|nr:hypothetical protein MKW92_043390 [Papaver armeniacum]